MRREGVGRAARVGGWGVCSRGGGGGGGRPLLFVLLSSFSFHSWSSDLSCSTRFLFEYSKMSMTFYTRGE